MTNEAAGGAVWKVEWPVGDDDYEAAYFTTEEAARSSASVDTEVSKVEVRTEALRVETRHRVWSSWRVGQPHPPVVGHSRYKVNELQEDYGLPLTEVRGWWVEGMHVHSRSLKEARAWVEDALAPQVQREQERLDYLATCTHQFRCPDHGDLSMSPSDNHVPCHKCRRWVNSAGFRFGRYEGVNEGGGRFTISFSAGGEASDHDLGPLPDDEAKYPRLPATSGSADR